MVAGGVPDQLAMKIQEKLRYLEDRWDQQAAGVLDPPELLRYRSNLLGSDLRITNFGGGNTSSKISQTDPLDPSSLGRLNGFLHASPQALLNASPNSAIGVLSKTYAEALAGYLAAGTTTTTTTVTEDDLAAILAKAANKPLTGEQILGINEKLMSVDPTLADLGQTTVTNPDGTTTTTNSLTDPTLADTLAGEANAIQANEANQGLGSTTVQ